MATAWRFVAYYALPVPIVLLLLLNIPAPRVFRKGVLEFVQRVFGLPLVGAFKLLHVMLFLTGVSLLSAVRVLHNLRQLEVEAVWPTANAELNHLSKRWRGERNAWIAAFAFTMWCVLAAFYREAVRRVEYEERLAAIEKAAQVTRSARQERDAAAAAGGAAPARERPAASSSHASKPAVSAGAAATEKLGAPSGGTAPTERVVAQPPAQPPLEPAAGIQMQELKKDL